jgi:signal transduction histidine kinase
VRQPAFVDLIGASRERLRISQRLHDASMVAGKIAHDFDNIFTGVVGFAEMVHSMLEPGSLQHQYVSEIVAAANRGIAFTAQLHQMSRSGAARMSSTSVSGVLGREEARLRKNANLDVKLQFASPNDLPPVAMDASALQQVLGNLLDNAVEASPPAGAVRVSASLIELSDEQAREFLGSASAGPFVELRIVDEGPGVREDHRKKLFVEPFFTTKVRHRGLGLPVALRVLTAHRGGVRYDAPARGSAFHVVLPLAAARAPELGGAL